MATNVFLKSSQQSIPQSVLEGFLRRETRLQNFPQNLKSKIQNGMSSIGKRLEQYTIKRPQEVLLVTVEIADEQDKVAIFKGFSSSLMRPTAFDPEIPVIPDEATIINIDRIASPYNPEAPRYIERQISWEAMQNLLAEVGV